MMARIPMMILNAENPPSMNDIPKNIKLTPIRTESVTELMVGNIIKINPKSTDNIPDT